MTSTEQSKNAGSDQNPASTSSTQINNEPSHLHRNRMVQVWASFFSKLADALINTKIVLPAILNAIAAPTFLIGMISPIRESFSMLPQMLIKSWVANTRRTNLVYLLGGLLQALSIAAMLVCFIFLEGWMGGIAVLAALLAMSLARSLCSLSSKTVLGATVPKSSRGNLMGLATSLAGLTGIGIGLALCLYAMNQSEMLSPSTSPSASLEAATPQLGRDQITLLLLSAVGGFAIAGLLYGWVKMPNREHDKKASDQGVFNPAMTLLREDKHFRDFVMTRALMMISALAMPFAASIALKNAASVSFTLGLLIALEGCSATFSGRIWGNAADKNSRRVLMITALASSAICLYSALNSAALIATPDWSWIAVYLCLSVVHQGVRLGRKTYVVDLADDQEDSNAKRAEYVAVSNTCIGVLLLIFGMSSALIAQISLGTMFLVFAVSGVLATILGSKLKTI